MQLAAGVYAKRTYVDFVKYVFDNIDWCWNGLEEGGGLRQEEEKEMKVEDEEERKDCWGEDVDFNASGGSGNR